jgi:hypothetical protein
MRLDLFGVIFTSKGVILRLDCSPHGKALADVRASLPEAFEQKRRTREISEMATRVVMDGHAGSVITDMG